MGENITNTVRSVNEEEKTAERQPALVCRNLCKEFDIRDRKFPYTIRKLKAVSDVSLRIERGETLGIVGESGSGKSTLGRLIMRLTEPTSGEVWLNGHNLTAISGEELRRIRHRFQIIFQDPYAAFNPRMTIQKILEEPLTATGLPVDQWQQKIDQILDMTGIPKDAKKRYPHEFSGGQRQRIGIARAILTGPELIVADEPVSALDVSVQAQILNLMKDLQEEMGSSMVFISHNMASVQYISHRIAVMYLGRIVEIAGSDALYENALHPYTKALIETIPIPVPGKGRERRRLEGEVPSPIDLPEGCVFAKRCPMASEICTKKTPVLQEQGNGHLVACHLYDTME